MSTATAAVETLVQRVRSLANGHEGRLVRVSVRLPEVTDELSAMMASRLQAHGLGHVEFDLFSGGRLPQIISVEFER